MSERGYTLIAWGFPSGLTRDQGMKYFEYVRRHARECAPEIPAECEFDIFASTHPHVMDGTLVPHLGFHIPAGVYWGASEKEVWGLLERLMDWIYKRPVEEMLKLIEGVDAPTWEELCGMKCYPVR